MTILLTSEVYEAGSPQEMAHANSVTCTEINKGALDKGVAPPEAGLYLGWGEEDGGSVPSSRTKQGGQGLVHGTWRWRGCVERPDEDPAWDLLARVTAGAGSPFLCLSPPPPFSLWLMPLLAAPNQAQGQGAHRCTVYAGQPPGCREVWRVDLGWFGVGADGGSQH